MGLLPAVKGASSTDSRERYASFRCTHAVNLVRRNGLPALTGHYLVDLLPRDGSQCGMFGQEDVLVKEGRQEIALASPECLDLVPNQVLGYASAPLLRAPLSDVCHHTSSPVPAHVDQPVADKGPTSTDPMVVSASDDEAEPEIPQQLLDRLQPEQRASFLRLWNDVPPHLRHITFHLDLSLIHI